MPDDKREPCPDEPAIASDNFAPIGEIAETLPRELDLGRERIMHPDERAGTRGHTSADVTLVDQRDSHPGARQMKRQATSDHARTDHDYIVI